MRKLFISILLVVILCGICQADTSKNYYYYLGAWVLDTDEATQEKFWRAPNNTIAMVDLRTMSQMGQSKDIEGVGFFATTQELDESYLYLGYGYISNVLIDDKIKDSWYLKTGYRPEGTTLLDLLWNQLTDGSDPLGTTTVKSLMPDSKLDLVLSLGGHSIVKKEKFDIKTHPHKEKVKSVLQNNFKKLKEESNLLKDKIKKDKIKDGKILKQADHYLRVLDMWGEQYKVSDPENYFIPEDLEKEKAIPHETAYTEDWNCSNSTNINCDQATWEEVSGDSLIYNNRISNNGYNNTSTVFRLNSDVSSTNMYGQSVFYTNGSNNVFRIFIRFSSSAVTAYAIRRYDAGAPMTYRLEKIVSGTTTSLASTEAAASFPETWKIEANGSSVKTYLNGDLKHSVTDTSITTNTRGGGGVYAGVTDANNLNTSLDDFIVSDISSGNPISNVMLFQGVDMKGITVQ